MLKAGDAALKEYEQIRNSVGDPARFKIVAPAKGKPGSGTYKPPALIWQAQEGMQDNLFFWSNHPDPRMQVDEILCGGRRGPGKTDALIAWMAEPVWHPKYVGLIVRFQAEALKEFIERCDEIYTQMGAKKKGRPPEYWFPSGARIYFGHLTDERSLSQYKGHQYDRIGLEEGTQIAERANYLFLFGSNRANAEGLAPKILITTNPDGPGHTWIRSQFVKVYDTSGNLIPHGTPFRDPITGRVRIFLQGGLGDNKILLQRDPGYYQRLRSQPPHIQKAWIDGDWDAGASQMYPEWREHGPLLVDGGMEPEWAKHVVRCTGSCQASRELVGPTHPIHRWSHRWASLDWGYSHHSAAYWGAIAEDKRVHVYREMVCRKVATDVLGAEWAKMTVEDVEGVEDHHIVLYLSHELFAFRNAEHTMADQFALGVQRIFGPGSVFVLSPSRKERELKISDPDQALRSMLARRAELGEALKITIRPCNPDRVAGASWLRHMLRFWPLDMPVKPDMAYAAGLLDKPYGRDKFEKYLEGFKTQHDEVLPRVVVHDCCRILIDTMPKLTPDPDRLEDVLKFHGDDTSVGDDPYEALRSLCMGYRDYEHKRKPFAVRLQEEVQRWVKPGDDINLTIQAAMRAREKLERTASSNIHIYLQRESSTDNMQADEADGGGEIGW